MKKFFAFLLLMTLVSACGYTLDEPTGDNTNSAVATLTPFVPNTPAPTNTPSSTPLAIATLPVLDPLQRPDLVQAYCGGNEGRVVTLTQGTLRCPSDLVAFATQISAQQTPLAALTTSGQWTVSYYDGATAQMRGWNWRNLEPQNWPTAANEPNPLVSWWDVSHGLEWGEDESLWCGVDDDGCHIVVAPESYILITGDYEIPALGISCSANQGVGCALLITNVGSVSADFVGTFNNVYEVSGRYFHGDYLPDAIVAGLGHASNVMLDLVSELNPEPLANAGGNCSNPDGCTGVLNRFVVTSGNERLIQGEVTIFR